MMTPRLLTLKIKNSLYESADSNDDRGPEPN